MSKQKRSTSEFLNEIKEEEQETHTQNEHKSKSKRDRTYITPDQFKSKSAKKENQTFFVSRINKPVKYTKDSNFFSYLIYRIGKDDASGLSAQLSYYFMLSLFPMLLFLLSIVPMVGIKQSTIRSMIKEHVPPDYFQSV